MQTRKHKQALKMETKLDYDSVKRFAALCKL